MATNHTENYALNLWTPQDSFLREEFNENTEKIDAAIKAVDTKVSSKADASTLTALAQTVAQKANSSALNALNTTVAGLTQTVNGKASTAALNALAQTVAGKGNCQIVCGSYVGDGTHGAEHPVTLTFDKPPILVFLAASDYTTWMLKGSPAATANYSYNGNFLYVSWSGNSVSFYADYAQQQLNLENKTTWYVALVQA